MNPYQQSLLAPNNANAMSLQEDARKEAEALNSKVKSSEEFLKEFDKDFSDYTTVARPAIKATCDAWKDEVEKTIERRKIRNCEINIDDERSAGRLQPDELYSPVRLVDSNIIREHAKNVQYLTKSARNVILITEEDANIDTSIEEKDFTLKGRYNAWELDFFQAMDGSVSHGWDFIEVVYDKTKPGHFANEHVGHENLFFPLDTKEFSASPFLVRNLEYTTVQLVNFTKYKGWDSEQVTKVIESSLDRAKSNDANTDRYFGLHKIQKIFYRNELDGFIYVAYCNHVTCDEWIRQPRKLYLGKLELNPQATSQEDLYVQLFETSYPIEPLLYSINEDKLLVNIKGRIDIDEPKQDAATSLLTTFLTKARRSAGLYFTSENNNGTPLDEAQTNVKLIEGRIFDFPLKQFKIDAPAPELVNAINLIIGQSQMERGDVNYAIQSNKSTRKTASEIDLAESESDLLNSIKTTLTSISLRNIFTRDFDIYQSRVKAGMIKVNPLVAQSLKNYTYIVKPAGDVDIVERKQKIMLMQQSWGVMQTTAAASEFLKDLIKLLFPEEAPRYIAALGSDNAKNNIIEVATSILKEIMLDPSTGQILPQYAQYADELAQLQQTIQQVVMQSEQGQGGASPQAPMNQMQQDSTLDIPTPDQQEAIPV